MPHYEANWFSIIAFTSVIIQLQNATADPAKSPKTGLVPQFLCDMENRHIRAIQICFSELVGPKVNEYLQKKLDSYLKGRSLYEYIMQLCKDAVQFILNARRVIESSAKSNDKKIVGSAFTTCTNATLYYMPYTPKTRYEDLDL